MRLVWDINAWEDYLWWQAQDRKVLKRINQLIQDVVRNGNEGIGKPEPLKHDFAGYWSRRITDEHRTSYPIERLKALSVQYLQDARRCPRGDLNPLDHPLEAQQIPGVQRFGEFTAEFSGPRGTPRGSQGTTGRTCPTRSEPARGGPVGRTHTAPPASVDRTGS
jgi:toxin YoeB